MPIPTPHISAKKEEIAKIVIMPGDPLRSKWYAEHYLMNLKLVNNVRNIQGYTGTWKDIPVTVMASGIGIPSIGIYAYELYNFYDVDIIIRAGTAGGLQSYTNLSDTVIAETAFTDSIFLSHLPHLPKNYVPAADPELVELLSKNAEAILKQKFKGTRKSYVGAVLSEELFYSHDEDFFIEWSKAKALCVEMESAALFAYATLANKKAAGIFTISDNVFTDEQMSAEKREKSVNTMFEIVLKTIEDIYK